MRYDVINDIAALQSQLFFAQKISRSRSRSSSGDFVKFLSLVQSASFIHILSYLIRVRVRSLYPPHHSLYFFLPRLHKTLRFKRLCV